MSEYNVGTTDDIPETGGLCAEIDGIEIAVFDIEGELYAVQNRCPHKQAPLCEAGSTKKNAEQCDVETRGKVDSEWKTINCPRHWWEWDLQTGENAVNDMRVRTFPVEVDNDQNIIVRT